MKNKVISLILSVVFIFSFVSVKAESTEYSLLNENYVRLLGRGEVIEGAEPSTGQMPDLNLSFREKWQKFTLIYLIMMTRHMRETISPWRFMMEKS